MADFDLNLDHLDEPLHLAMPSWMVAKYDRFNYATSVVARVGRVNFVHSPYWSPLNHSYGIPPTALVYCHFFISPHPKQMSQICRLNLWLLCHPWFYLSFVTNMPRIAKVSRSLLRSTTFFSQTCFVVPILFVPSKSKGDLLQVVFTIIIVNFMIARNISYLWITIWKPNRKRKS